MVFTRERVTVQRVLPEVAHGRHPAKAIAGRPVDVHADLVCDSHDVLAGVVRWRAESGGDWREERSVELGLRAAQASAALAAEGVTAVSPIAQASLMVSAPCDAAGARLDPLDAAFWERWCRPLLQRCDSVIVPKMQGWDRSRGIWAEVMTALERSKPIFVWRGI